MCLSSDDNNGGSSSGAGWPVVITLLWPASGAVILSAGVGASKRILYPIIRYNIVIGKKT